MRVAGERPRLATPQVIIIIIQTTARGLSGPDGSLSKSSGIARATLPSDLLAPRRAGRRCASPSSRQGELATTRNRIHHSDLDFCEFVRETATRPRLVFVRALERLTQAVARQPEEEAFA